MQNNAIEINPGSKNVTISDCTFSRSWDAVSALADADNILIYGNSFTNIRDDGIQLGSSTSNVDIGYNRMIHVFTGISRHGSGDCPEPGTKFIHHNIIDSSKPMFVRRGDPLNLLKKKHAWLNGPEMMNNPPFGVHRLKHIGTDPYRIYNNTIIFRRSPSRYGVGITVSETNRSAIPPSEIYNNIMMCNEDGEILRLADCGGGTQIYDGNIYFKPVAASKTPYFYQYLINNKHRHFFSLENFRKSECASLTRIYYPPGWDSESIIADPLLDTDYTPSAFGPAATKGITLNQKWPNFDSLYRGAIPPRNE